MVKPICFTIRAAASALGVSALGSIVGIPRLFHALFRTQPDLGRNVG